MAITYETDTAADGSVYTAWWAEDDTRGCAGQGDPNANPPDVIEHMPRLYLLTGDAR